MSETEDKTELEVEAPEVEEASPSEDQNDSGIDKDIEKLSVSENDDKPEEEIGITNNNLIFQSFNIHLKILISMTPKWNLLH